MSANSNFVVAVHSLMVLAYADGPVSSSLMATSVNTNPVTIRKMVGLLHTAGLVNTLPGSMGGAYLAKPANKITLADIYQITREETLFGLHPNPPNPNCPIGRNIQALLLDVFDGTDQLLIQFLGQITLQALVDAVRAREQIRQP
jgi:DNA-binding IscR family transcriptional regulator